MSAHSIPRYTVEQYLALDQDSKIPFEYCDGEMFPIVAATPAHGAIAGNIHGLLYTTLEGRDCQVLASTVRVRAGMSYVHSDISVVCGQPAFADDADTMVNPVLVVEILSKSTEGYDRGAKFSHYRKIDALKEYALVAQSEPRIEVYLRDPAGFWIYREFTGMEAVCHFSSIDCYLPLAKVYRNISFAARASEAP
jgi:Uma2 family endonuclease